MIYNIPVGTTALDPFILNLQNIDTSQLLLEPIQIKGSGTCFLRLPSISSLPVNNASFVIIGTSNDAIITVTPNGGDYISTNEGLVSISDEMVITGLGNATAVNTVMSTGFNGGSSGLWFSPSSNPSSNTNAYYYFGDRVVTWSTTNNSDYRFIISSELLHKRVPAGFTPLAASGVIYKYVNNVQTIVNASFSFNGILNGYLPLDPSATYIILIEVSQINSNSDIVTSNYVSIVDIDSSGGIINQIALAGTYPAQITNNDLIVTAHVTPSNQLVSFDWSINSISNPSIQTGTQLVYTAPSSAETRIYGKMTIDALLWPNIADSINNGTIGYLEFNIITQ